MEESKSSKRRRSLGENADEGRVGSEEKRHQRDELVSVQERPELLSGDISEVKKTYRKSRRGGHL